MLALEKAGRHKPLWCVQQLGTMIYFIIGILDAVFRMLQPDQPSSRGPIRRCFLLLLLLPEPPLGRTAAGMSRSLRYACASELAHVRVQDSSRPPLLGIVRARIPRLIVCTAHSQIALPPALLVATTTTASTRPNAFNSKCSPWWLSWPMNTLARTGLLPARRTWLLTTQ